MANRSAPTTSRAAWSRLAACTAAAALLQLDGTLITVALPSVARSLHISSASTSVLLTAYFAAYAITLPAGGALVDRYGPRRPALIGLGIFALGAAAGALCPDLLALALTRVVQGAGAGLVSPAALTGAVSGFPPEARGRALGAWGASAGVSNLLGPLLGGLLTLGLGWRADWWALVPLGSIALVAIVMHVPRRIRPSPTTPETGARNPVVLVAAFIAAVTFAVMIGSFYIGEQYLQRGAGYSSLAASMVLVAVAGLVGVAAPLAGRLADRRGERIPAAAGFTAAGTGLLVLGIPGVPLTSPASIAPLVVIGLGLGLLFVPVSRAALNATPVSLHGRTSAVLSGGRLLGAAIGAGLGGLALSAGANAANVHNALLLACALCLAVGAPASWLLRAPTASRGAISQPGDARA
jgi:MFS transporter, DHA2 family, methylenomycin A resistance protein